MTQKELVEITKEYFTVWATKTITTKLMLVAPWAFVPVLAPLTNRFIKFIVETVAEGGDKYAFFLVTDIRLAQQGRDFVRASRSLKDAIISGNPETIKKAEHEKIIAANAIIKLSI